MNFQNKICVITGGAAGIGRCLTEEFAKQGAKVCFIDKSEEDCKITFEKLQKIGADGFYYVGDIAEVEVLRAFADKIIKTYGGIDMLINNACLSKKGILSSCSYEDFSYVLRVGISAPYFLSQLFLEHFRKNASIVNIASTRAVMSQSDTESYSAAKGGISALTHALSVSLAGKVRVNSVSPGWIETKAYHQEDAVITHTEADKLQHPVKRVGIPLDIAKTVMFLCDEENGFITGENITVDGGMTKLMIYNGDEGWTYDADSLLHG